MQPLVLSSRITTVLGLSHIKCSSRDPSLEMAYYMLITFLPCLSLLRLAIWKAEVMATILATKMDCEGKDYTLEMLEW